MEIKKIVLIVIVLIVIYMFFRYLFKDINTLQNGVINGQNLTTINASSLATNGTNSSSNNFAYSIWFYVNDWNYRYGEPKVIYGRMGAPSLIGGGSIDNISGVDPCPAVVLGAIENNLSIALGCYTGTDSPSTNAKSVVHTCNVANVPIQKWVNLLVSVYGRTMDVYIDGKLVKTCLLPGIAMIDSNANVYITPNGGFNGWTSKFQYWPNPLNPQDAWNTYSQGYGNSILGNLFGSYEIEISVLENGTTQNSIKF